MDERMQQRGASGVLITDVLRAIAHAISIGTATAFILSVIYEQAYFSVIGEKFETIASLSDYLTNVLDWLPTVASAIVAYAIIVLAYVTATGPPGRKGYSHRAPSFDEDVKTSADEKTVTIEQQKPQGYWLSIMILLFMGLIALLICFLFDPASSAWVLGATSSATLVWVAVFLLAFYKLRDSDVGDAGRLMLVLGPPAVVFVFLWGLHHGYRDLNEPSEIYSLIREGAVLSTAEKVNLLRVFDRGVLIRSGKQQINEFLPWDQVRSITLPRGGQAGKSFGCQRLGWAC